MSRKGEFQNQNQNPAKRFLEWKSNDKTFSYYDKEKGANVSVKLPFKFLTLKELHTVKGWNDNSESAIYSNEVKFIGTEPLTVKSFKGGELAKGLYKDIRSRVKDVGGHYVKSIYIMSESGEIYNLQLKGSAVQMWGDFTKKTRSRLSDEWVSVTGADERKKGSIEYSVPIFKYGQSLCEDDCKNADEVYAVLDMYIQTYLAGKAIDADTPPEIDVDFKDGEISCDASEVDLESDDLPF